MTITNQVQASPGLYVNTPGQPITNHVPLPVQVGMFPPNANNQGGGSTIGALANAGAAGLPTLQANTVISGPGNVGLGVGNAGGFGSTAQTVLATIGTGGANGSASPLANNPGGSPNVGMPSTGPEANANNGGNPGALPQAQANAPAVALTYPAGNTQYAG